MITAATTRRFGKSDATVLADLAKLESRYGFDAVESIGRRRKPTSRVRSEDAELTSSQRRQAVGGMRDVIRNYAVARWAIGKHLDFVASHGFHCRSGDRGLDREFEQFVESLATAEAFDLAGRHPLWRAIRMAEARRVIDGDVLAVRTNQKKIQWIEADRIRDPDYRRVDGPLPNTTHGVQTGPAGEALAYAVHRRAGDQFAFERLVPARNAYLHACYDLGRFDQVRGISPVLSAMNTLQDTYEGIDYALAKMKVAQLFGLAIFNDQLESPGDVENEGDETDPRYKVDFGRGPFLLHLDPGDRAEFLTADTPGPATKEFISVTIGIALKSLDLPFSFYDEAYTNFFGSKSALVLYLKSAKEKRKEIRALLNDWAQWRLGWAIADGEFVLPRSKSFEDLRCSWVPDGLPWWDTSREVSGDVASIAAGLRTRAEIRMERFGDDVYDVWDRLAEEQQYLTELGIAITEAPPEVFVPQPVQPETANA